MKETPRRRYWRLVATALLSGPLVLLATSVSPAAAATLSCSSSTPAGSRPQLRIGDTGTCVTTLQRQLIAKGYSIGTSSATGYFGSGTDNAVRRFQTTKLDLLIDGVVGPATWQRLVVGGGTTYSVTFGPNTSARVILSYDDCPKSYASFQATVLGAQQLGVALVLAPTGNCLGTGRFSSSYARAHGHYVINHSVSHADLTTLSYSGVRYQLGPPGVVTSYGRPPYGAHDFTARQAYASRSMRMWLWDVDTNDWRGKTQSQVVSHVVSYSRSNDTVLMHMGWNAFNTSAISQMRSGLAARGLGVCRNPGTATPTYPRTIGC